MQVCPQCQYFTFNDRIIVTAKQILFSFQLFQQLIGICYRIIQASPYRINPYLRCRILKIILLVILIIIGNRRPLLSFTCDFGSTSSQLLHDTITNKHPINNIFVNFFIISFYLALKSSLQTKRTSSGKGIFQSSLRLHS